MAACTDPVTGVDPIGPDAGATGDVAEGSTGTIRVTTPNGSRELSYIVRNGHAMHEEDIDLGPISELHERGGAASLGFRWPNSVAFFRFDATMAVKICETNGTNCIDARQRVRETLAAMSAQLPIAFVEDTLHIQPNFITFKYSLFNTSPGQSNSIGIAGGEQTISFLSNQPGSTQPFFFQSGPGEGTIRHETLHAIGLWHEHTRSDRDDFITLNVFCIDINDIGNFTKQPGSADLGPYDFDSIMHYSVRNGCAIVPPDTNCLCDTFTTDVPGAVMHGNPTRGGFSIEDTNTLFRMYARPKATSQTGDSYGGAIAIGDFDADGYDDMAVGIPDENLDGHGNAGAVIVYKGTSAGPVVWQVLSQRSLPGESLTDGAHFGRALVVLDFDADGFDDLAVGAPSDNNDGTGSGFVMVFRGSETLGLAASRKLNQSILGYNGDDNDRFGAALAAGPVTGLTRTNATDCGGAVDNLKYDALVIGAPGDRTSGEDAGAVYVVQQFFTTCSSTLAATTRFVGPTPAAGDRFGAAVAVGHLDNGGKADVAVGAPGRGNTGAVYLYNGTLPPEASPLLWSSMVTSLKATTIGTSGSDYGSALAIGNILTTNTNNELVVGAPGGVGFVRVMNGMSTATVATLQQGNPESGDDFGAALAIGNVDHADDAPDLVVGAPGEDGGIGAISIFQGDHLGTRSTLFQSGLDPNQFDEASDRFGSALAAGQLDGRQRASTAHTGSLRTDLAVGAPGERVGSGPLDVGVVTLGHGTADELPEPWMTINQEHGNGLF